MKNDWTKWLAGGIVAAFLLSVSVTWALVQDQKVTYTRDMDRIILKLDEANTRLARIEGHLGIKGD